MCAPICLRGSRHSPGGPFLLGGSRLRPKRQIADPGVRVFSGITILFSKGFSFTFLSPHTARFPTVGIRVCRLQRPGCDPSAGFQERLLPVQHSLTWGRVTLTQERELRQDRFIAGENCSAHPTSTFFLIK